jgi:hypothetical protein
MMRSSFDLERWQNAVVAACASKQPWYQKPETGPAGLNAGLSAAAASP